jgi:hypothetical protein
MEATLTVDLTKFNVGCAVYAAELKKTPREVVTEQAGLLMSDLARNLPPRDPDATKQKIETSVNRKFSILATSTADNTFIAGGGGKEGHGDVHWIGSTANSLFGISREADKTQASPEDLRKLFYSTTNSGKQRAGQRGKQRVYISQKITTLESTRQKLIKIIQDRIGLLRASFCTGYSDVGGKRRLPAFVMKHIASGKAKGSFINGLGQPDKAEFTIVSSADGVSDEKCTYFLQGALNRRGEAMMSRIHYLQRESKKKAGFQ